MMHNGRLHLKFFVGHKRPEFNMWPGYLYCAQNNGDETLPKDSAIDEMSDKVLSEYHSLFLLRKKIKTNQLDDGLITICQHRRFVLNSELGQRSINQPFARVISASDVDKIDGGWLFLKSGDYLIGTPSGVQGSIFSHYYYHHHIRDLLRFVADLVDARLFTNEDAKNFISADYFIPAPGCGTFNLKTFIDIFEYLEKCAIAFHLSGYQVRSGYQGRVTSFLLERLNSFILLKYLNNQGLDFKKYVGYTTVVNEGVIIKGG